MKVAIFVSIWAASVSSTEMKDYFSGKPLDFLKGIKEVSAVELYVPEIGELPIPPDDLPAPTIIVQIDVDGETIAQAVADSSEFKALFMDEHGFDVPVEKINLELMEPINYPLSDQDRAPPRTAPISVVVRYYGPVENQSDFVSFYTTNHPPLLTRLPEVRNVLCYLPLGWAVGREITDDEIVIGNEVVFDDMESLRAALQSDAVGPLMADHDKFAPYGYATHQAMKRALVYSR